MTRYILAVSIMLMMICASSCRKSEINGDLDGQWQYVSVDYPDGISTEPKGFYLCISLHLAQLTDSHGISNRMIHTANMTYSGDRMLLEFPRASYNDIEPWGFVAPDGSDMDAVGVTVGFRISHLSSERLVLISDEGVTITMRKY